MQRGNNNLFNFFRQKSNSKPRFSSEQPLPLDFSLYLHKVRLREPCHPQDPAELLTPHLSTTGDQHPALSLETRSAGRKRRFPIKKIKVIKLSSAAQPPSQAHNGEKGAPRQAAAPLHCPKSPHRAAPQHSPPLRGAPSGGAGTSGPRCPLANTRAAATPHTPRMRRRPAASRDL